MNTPVLDQPKPKDADKSSKRRVSVYVDGEVADELHALTFRSGVRYKGQVVEDALRLYLRDHARIA